MFQILLTFNDQAEMTDVIRSIHIDPNQIRIAITLDEAFTSATIDQQPHLSDR